MKKYVVRLENISTILWDPYKKMYFQIASKSFDLNSIYDKETLLNYITGLDSFPSINSKDLDLNDIAYVIENRRKSQRKLFAPLEYYFDYTSRCNLKCKGCYNEHKLNKSTMSKENIISIISEMKRLGIMRLHLAGGEPLIDYDLLKCYLECATTNDIVVSMATNGILLSEEMCDMILSFNPFAISVSLDGYDEKTNSHRRGDGNFNKSVLGIKNLVDAKKRIGCDTEICIKPVFETDYQEDFFEKMIKLSIDLGVDKIKFSNPERSMHHEMGHYGKSVSNYYKNMALVLELIKKYSSKIKITSINNPAACSLSVGISNMKGCIGSQELIAINPDGSICPCLMNNTFLGNYFDYGSMEEFYNKSTLLNNYQAKISSNKCNNCKFYPQCRGGCQVRKLVESNDLSSIDPCCPLKLDRSLFDAKIKASKDENLQPIFVLHSL